MRKLKETKSARDSTGNDQKNGPTTELAECQQRKRNNYRRQNTELKRATFKAKQKYLVAAHRTLTLNCLSNSVLELGPLPGNMTWSYAVTLAVIRLIYLWR